MTRMTVAMDRHLLGSTPVVEAGGVTSLASMSRSRPPNAGGHGTQGYTPRGRAMKMSATERPQKPRQVVLFSGHLIDAVDRANPRFPPSAEPQAAAAIAAAVERLNLGPGDLGINEGACGGDLLFCEAL